MGNVRPGPGQLLTECKAPGSGVDVFVHHFDDEGLESLRLESSSRRDDESPLDADDFRLEDGFRRANGDLRSQRDGLVDEVASLKKELAQTRLVLHGMEYYAAGHQHQTMAL